MFYKPDDLVDFNFQTPVPVAKYMVSLIPEGDMTILEPTPGIGNIVKALIDLYAYPSNITAPKDYFKFDQKQRFDCVIMNPPFSDKNCFNVPPDYPKKGLRMGYQMLLDAMRMSDHVIALMPWFVISDSDVRLRRIYDFGLKSITCLPRRTFDYIRIQTVIFELSKDFAGDTVMKVYDRLSQSQLYLHKTG